jgi:hypothetical protein
MALESLCELRQLQESQLLLIREATPFDQDPGGREARAEDAFQAIAVAFFCAVQFRSGGRQAAVGSVYDVWFERALEGLFHTRFGSDDVDLHAPFWVWSKPREFFG